MSAGQSKKEVIGSEVLLTVDQVAERLGTSVSFPRHLIAQRRIRFVRLGRHVRIPESGLAEFIAAGMVEPLPPRRPRWLK
jgi:excisionase family DNA binding protein